MSYRKIKQCDVCGSTLTKDDYSLKVSVSGIIPCEDNKVCMIDSKLSHVCIDCIKELDKVLIYNKTIKKDNHI